MRCRNLLPLLLVITIAACSPPKIETTPEGFPPTSSPLPTSPPTASLRPTPTALPPSHPPITVDCAFQLEPHLSDTLGDSVLSVDWFPGDYRIAVVVAPDGLLYLDPYTLKSVPLALPDVPRPRVVAVAPYGEFLAVGESGGTIHILGPNGDPVFDDPAHEPRELTSLSWSPGGSYLASGGKDNRIRILPVPQFEPTAPLEFGFGPVNSVDWAPNGELIAAGGEPMNLSVWHFPSRVHLVSLRLKPDPRNVVAWLHESDMLASAGMGISVLQLSSGLTWSFGQGVYFTSLAASPIDNLIIAGASVPSPMLFAFEPTTRVTLAALPLPSPAVVLKFSRSGNLLAAGLADGTIILWQCPEHP